MQVGQSVPAATRMEAPSVAKASLRRAKRGVFRGRVGGDAVAECAGAGRGAAGRREAMPDAAVDAAADAPVMKRNCNPRFPTGDDSAGQTRHRRTHSARTLQPRPEDPPAYVGDERGRSPPAARGANLTFSNGRRFAYFQFSSRVVGSPSTARVSIALRRRSRLTTSPGSDAAAAACCSAMRVARDAAITPPLR